MGQTYRKAYTRRLPPGAEIVDRAGVRVARWRLRNGQLRTAELADSAGNDIRVRGQSPVYTARYRDAAGRMVEVSTGCRDQMAARAVLVRLEREAELARAGVLSDTEYAAVGHANAPIEKHFDAYQRHLETKGCAPRRVSMVRRRLERLAAECRFARLSQLDPARFEAWLLEQKGLGLSASTRNSYRESAICFANWCRRTRRLTSHSFADVPLADVNADRRHLRRALTTDEIARVLKVARLRPLAEYGREVVKRRKRPSRGKRTRATWKRAAITIKNIDAAAELARETLADNPAFKAELERVGRERELLYLVLVTTGLRKGELATLTVGQLDFSGPVAQAVLKPANEKNRQGSTIPLRADVAHELRTWLDVRLIEHQRERRRRRRAIPTCLPADAPVLRVPSGLTRILDRDLAAAGIAKRDERGRVVDVHALRVTFGSHLCAAGVPLRTAQAAMRHSKPELTANIYVDPRLLDVSGAIESLPRFAVPGDAATPSERAHAAMPTRRAE